MAERGGGKAAAGGQGSAQSQWLLLAAITATALYLTWRMISPFVDVLVWASVLVIVFYPVHVMLVERTKRPGLSALLSLVIVIATVLVPLLVVGSAVVAQLSAAAGGAQSSLLDFVAHPQQNPWVQRATEVAGSYLDLRTVLSPENVRSVATRASQMLVQGTVGVVGGALGFVGKLFFVTFTMFYLFRDAPAVVARLEDLLPMGRARSRELLHQTREIINASVYGVVAIAGLQGLLGGLMLAVLGVPSALLLGVLMGLLSMVPLVGGALVWVPTAVVLMATGHLTKGIVLAAWCVLVVGSVDNLVRPRLVGTRTQMHDLLVFFSVLGGLHLFGMVGILLGPVVFAITLGLLAVFREGGAGDERATP